MNLSITQAQARRFLLKKQLLFSPQSLRGYEGIENVFQQLRIIQYDPLNPCGRNPDLVLQSRIGDYHPDLYHKWLYTEKKGIECYDKELCIIPIEDFSLTDHRRLLVQDRSDQKQFLKTYKKQIEALLERIAEEGEISSSDIKDITRVDSGWGTDALFGRIALETLWRMGRLVISRREKGRKYYDLPSKVHLSLREQETSLYSGLTKEHIRRRLGSVGLLPLSGGGGGWQGLRGVRKIMKEMVQEGELREVAITYTPRVYVMAKTDEQVIQENTEMTEKKVVFIAPLDNLMWDRQMILELFHFHYRWEVYTPAAKRAFGYYVLPILYGDTFIGRIEPVLTKERKLEVRGFWQEDKKLWNKEVWRAFSKGLETFKTYLNAIDIINAPTK